MRGKKYQAASAKLQAGKSYSLAEAVNLVNETSYSTFGGSCELHIRLIGKKPEDRQFRAVVTLPHGTGKSQRVEVLTEEGIEAIARSGQASADLYLATPDLMPKVAKIAKLLGPKGKMPNPKSGTVTANPEERKKELSAGNSAEIRTDAAGIIHLSIGKASWEQEKLLENAATILKAVPRSKIGSLILSATMGPGIKVSLT